MSTDKSKDTAKAWNKGVEGVQKEIEKLGNRVDRYDPTGIGHRVGNAIGDVAAAGAKNQGERAGRFQRDTGVSVKDQVERGIGPASESLASEQP